MLWTNKPKAPVRYTIFLKKLVTVRLEKSQVRFNTRIWKEVHRKPAHKIAPEKHDREIPRKTGDDNPKRVSNELENGNAELDYLIILPAALNYEQPVNESVPDAWDVIVIQFVKCSSLLTTLQF